MKMTREQLIESVARMMASAYWRGRFAEIESWHDQHGEADPTRKARQEQKIAELSERDQLEWEASAKVAIDDALL